MSQLSGCENLTSPVSREEKKEAGHSLFIWPKIFTTIAEMVKHRCPRLRDLALGTRGAGLHDLESKKNSYSVIK